MLTGPLPRIVRTVVLTLELLTMAILAALVVLAVGGLLMELVPVLRPPFLAGDDLAHVLDHVLAVFVLIELLATAAAYVRGTDVLRRIFEAVFVAIARKLITTELGAAPLEKAAALGLLLLAAGATWWLVARAVRIKQPAAGP